MFQFKYVVVLLLICSWIRDVKTVSVNYQAINSSCVNSSYLVRNSTPYQLSVSPLSYVDIQIDFRHLQSLQDLTGVVLTVNISNVDTQSTYSQILDLTISTNSYKLYAANNIILSASFQITDSTIQFTRSRSYMIAESMSVYIRPPMPTDQVQQSFLFVITKKDLISLPYNTIPSSNLNTFNGYFLTDISDKINMKSRESSINSYSDYWNGIDQIVTPFIPYFSNCQYNGNYLYFSQMIHNASECDLYGYNSSPINQLKFGSSAIADKCKITRSCMYDQIPSVSSEYPFWTTLDASSKFLFSITAKEYVAPYTPIPRGELQSNELVSCMLSASGDNTTSQFPMKITIQMGYYQIDEKTRQIMTCSVKYSLYSPATSNFTYQLELVFAPLNNTQILLAFGFNWYVYILVFIIIGFISNMQFLVFWVYHVVTSAKKKINTRILVCLKMLKQIFKGVFFAILIIIMLLFAVQIVMNGTFFGSPLSTQTDPFWNKFVVNNIGYFASTNLSNIQMARFGFSYIIVSIYLAYQLSRQLIGQQRSMEQNESYEILGRKFKPSEWNRGKLIFGSILIALSSIAYLYFTYSNFFNQNIWFFIVSMQVGQMILQEVLYSLYDNILACLHLKICIGVLAYLATMGAIDLYYFVLGYLVDVAISTIEIAYLTQIQQRVTSFVQQKNEQLHRFYLNLLNEDDQQQQEKKSLGDNALLNNNQHIILDINEHEVQLLQEEIVEEYNKIQLKDFEPRREENYLKKLFVQVMVERNKQELEQQKILNYNSNQHKKDSHKEKELERLQRETEQFDLLVDCSTNMMQYQLQPIVVLMLWITYNSSAIMQNFQIASQNCILYFLSTVILAVCYQINIIIIINVLEVYFNYDYKKLIEKLLERFNSKRTFWITDEQYNRVQVQGLQTKLRGCYKYCLSSQMFFVVSLLCFTMYLFVIGFTTIIASQSNIFKDPFIIFIIAFWLLCLHFFKWVLMKIVYFFDIWGYKTLSQQNNKTENQDDYYADQETEQIMLHESAAVSSNIFTYKLLTQESQYKAENLRKKKKMVFQSKLKTICKSLEPTFQKEDFRLQYSIKNKEFIRKNIEKILPLIEYFPQNDCEWLGKTSSENVSKMKKQAKNVDPMISDFITGWLKRVEANRSRRQQNGIERQRRLKKCNFCFKTWALYYGYDGLCLDCSRELFESQNKVKKQ